MICNIVKQLRGVEGAGRKGGGKECWRGEGLVFHPSIHDV